VIFFKNQLWDDAGFSIAFNSKSKELNKVCDVVIKEKNLKEILKYIE
jgi:hypothetical protein